MNLFVMVFQDIKPRITRIARTTTPAAATATAATLLLQFLKNSLSNRCIAVIAMPITTIFMKLLQL